MVNLGNHQFEIAITDPKRLRGSNSKNENAEGISEIKTAMPGKLVRILTEVGAEIKQGESVLVVEAMKIAKRNESPERRRGQRNSLCRRRNGQRRRCSRNN